MTTRGRLAPTPTGLLHVGHARTFATAARRAAGDLVWRLEDLDLARCRPEFAAAALDDLRWLGLVWQEGPDCGGPHGPYRQSARDSLYRDAWQRLATPAPIPAVIWRPPQLPRTPGRAANRFFPANSGRSTGHCRQIRAESPGDFGFRMVGG